MSPPDAAVQHAYRHCEAITRREAANFYYGICLLPPAKRRAMCAVYAFARRVDDIGDDPGDAAEKLSQLKRMRAQLHAQASDADQLRLALGDAEQRFGLPFDALTDLIAGVEMDVREHRYDTFDELTVYCRRVAGTIGRLCLAIFGSSDPHAAFALADDLGVAMQVTNIVRDVREDLDRGRVYLPAEDLARFGCQDLDTAPAGDFAGLISFEVARAREWFDRGLGLLELIDARSGSCVGAMTGIYRRILARIDAHPESVRQQRVSLAPWEKTWVTVCSIAGASRTARHTSSARLAGAPR